MATTKGKAKLPDGRLTAQIARELADDLLPIDTPFDLDDLAEAARFVCEAAIQRDPGTPSMAIETVPGPVGERLMRIAVIGDDMPFIVDSLAAAIADNGLAIDRLVHPVVDAVRDERGRLKAIGNSNGKAEILRESIVYAETERADARTRTRLRQSLDAAMADVGAAVKDWPAMQAVMARDADAVAARGGGLAGESAALMRWLRGGMLTQLGHVLRRRDGGQSEVLGICRSGTRALLAPDSYDRAFAWFEQHKGKGARGRDCNVLIVKSNHVSRVHRRVPLDLFLVPVFEQDRVTALSVHAGIWTSAALSAPPDAVPSLRSKLSDLAKKLDLDPSGHAGKALVHALTALPHDLLIGFTDADLERVATSMMSLVDRPRPRLVLVRAPLERHLFAFVWLPRDAVSTAVRLRIRDMLEGATDGKVLDWSLNVEGGNLALLQFVIDIREGKRSPNEAALDRQLHAMVRGWSEAVEAELAVSEGAARASAIAARYAESFPPEYRTAAGPAEAAIDIHRLRDLAPPIDRGARLHSPPGSPEGQLWLKLYQHSGALALSDAVPMMENFGFRVCGEVPTLLQAGGLGAIHDFQLALPVGVKAEALLARAAIIEAAIADVLNGVAQDDAFNRLITAAGLAAQEANWLRAWYRYLRQAGMGYGVPTVVDALQHAPEVTRGILDLFVARHQPHFNGDRRKASALAERMMVRGLSKVAAINDDRLLRQFRQVVEAILRTNAFVDSSRTALAFKLDSALIPGLPKPVPWREIFVYSPQVEGIHLRAGPIARGGLRWSDRRDDFRTEVLGLMKAQRVKNAVIVPTGAKGGFYPKRLPDPSVDRESWAAEGKASYQTFVRSLLSLTDNLVAGKVVHPAGMVVRDADDPYFVVAADKGTATFSDTANAIAAEFDFWLDDAFASGGSKGYDHKAMGITARGAWLSVQRHFLETGVDVQRDNIRVAGCGDMSGDVFGNGMLMSKAIKLVAAFDHRHIFIDPDPDPAKSWAERKRMFGLSRSSWDDYSKKLISAGGGVYPRSLKDIPLSREAREVLGMGDGPADPESVIAAILRSPVDLLWFGGIGTYVKSSGENNIQVGDPANDALRVNGSDIRATVVGEGANLGCTQAGRIEYALRGAEGRGGRINTDFIDNSAGVDCSDKEVNIKIALASARRAGRLTEPARVKLLEKMTNDVAALVLEDNRLQALALSIAQLGGPGSTASYLRLIDLLEERGQLDRKTEGLPDSDILVRRAGDGHGLTRPELAVMLSSAKLALQDAIERSALPEDPGLETELLDAFPPEMRSRYKRDILAHRLRNEIISTRLANRMVNRIGVIHPFELVEEEGATLAQVTSAFVAAERLFGMSDLWRAIEAAAMPEMARLKLLRRSASALRLHMADLLRAGATDNVPSRLVTELGSGVTQLAGLAEKLLGGEALAQSITVRGALVDAGAPEREAAMVARLGDLDGSIGLARLARETRINIADLTRNFAEFGARLGLDWVQATAAQMRPTDPWERLLVAGLARDLQQIRLDFLRRIAGRRSTTKSQTATDLKDRVAGWIERHPNAVKQFGTMVGRARGSTSISPAMLAQIAGQARNLLAR